MKKITRCKLPCSCEFDMEFLFTDGVPDEGTIIATHHLCPLHESAEAALIACQLENMPEEDIQL